MTAMLRRNGYKVNHKRVERIWKQGHWTLPRKRKKRRRGQSVVDRPHAAGRPNEVWSYDFVHDRTQYGQRLKMLTVVDEYTRECIEIRVEKRMRSMEVMETLDELIQERGAPAYIRSDNESVFIANNLTD
jgi:transposase InsO family protein